MYMLIFVGALNLLSCGQTKQNLSSSEEISLETIERLKSNAIAVFKESLANGRTLEDSRQATVQWLLRQAIVKSAGVSSDKETVWVILKNGVELDISQSNVGSRCN